MKSAPTHRPLTPSQARRNAVGTQWERSGKTRSKKLKATHYTEVEGVSKVFYNTSNKTKIEEEIKNCTPQSMAFFWSCLNFWYPLFYKQHFSTFYICCISCFFFSDNLKHICSDNLQVLLIRKSNFSKNITVKRLFPKNSALFLIWPFLIIG